MWHLLPPSGYVAVQWGRPGDLPAPGDYDGDGRADFGIVTSSGNWNIVLNTGGTRQHQLGQAGDIPVPGHNAR